MTEPSTNPVAKAEITEVFEKYVEDELHWQVAVLETLSDGTQRHIVHQFHWLTPHMRAAEYGLDPSDADAALDIVLTERFVNALPDAPEPGETLYGTATVEEARAKHTNDCARAKLALRMSTRSAHTKPIRDRHDPQAVDALRARADKARRDGRNARQHRRQGRAQG